MSAGTISFDLDGTLIHGPFGAVLRELDAELAEQGVPGIRARILEEHERRLQSPDIGSAYDWDAIARWAAGAALPFDLVDRPWITSMPFGELIGTRLGSEGLDELRERFGISEPPSTTLYLCCRLVRRGSTQACGNWTRLRRW